MATLKVQPNGNAPSNAKTGDHIVTAGGTYEVLDGSQYQGKSAEELASAGVGFNPSSGLYSKKISDVSTAGTKSTIPQVSLRTPDTARQWANTQNQKISADLDSAFYQNRQDAYNSYMDAITRQNQQANNVNQAYLDNISKLYDDTYANNQAALQRATSRGLSSSGLGNAMQVAALADASKQNAQYRAQRNTQLNNIEAEMNNLTNQYNVNLDTLAKKLRSDKISALSQNEVAFLQAVMEMEEYNANVENSMLATQQQQAFDAEQSMLQREYEASQKALDRQLEMDMLLKQLEARSFSGGGGYGRGGYSRRGWGGYSRGGYNNYSSSGSSGGDFVSSMGLQYANAKSTQSPGGFLNPDRHFVSTLIANGAPYSEIKAASDAAHLNSIAIGNGKTKVIGTNKTGSTHKTKTDSKSSSSGTKKSSNSRSKNGSKTSTSSNPRSKSNKK